VNHRRVWVISSVGQTAIVNVAGAENEILLEQTAGILLHDPNEVPGILLGVSVYQMLDGILHLAIAVAMIALVGEVQGIDYGMLQRHELLGRVVQMTGMEHWVWMSENGRKNKSG
jgi:hypothetical protein